MKQLYLIIALAITSFGFCLPANSVTKGESSSIVHSEVRDDKLNDELWDMENEVIVTAIIDEYLQEVAKLADETGADNVKKSIMLNKAFDLLKSDTENLKGELRNQELCAAINLLQERAKTDGLDCQMLSRYYSCKSDFKEVFKWASQGANLGNAECMSFLHDCFLQGKGALQDTSEAFKWVYLASAHGDIAASEKVVKFNKILLHRNESQVLAKLSYHIDEGKKRAKAWKKEQIN
jgi:TPR repeat protein